MRSFVCMFHKNRKAVKAKRDRANAEIELLDKGILPSERHLLPPPPSVHEALDSASTPHNAAHVAGPTQIAPAGRRGGATGKAGGEDSERAPPPAGNVVDSDDEGEGEEQEDEDARASNYYAIPSVALERIKQVILQHRCRALCMT